MAVASGRWFSEWHEAAVQGAGYGALRTLVAAVVAAGGQPGVAQSSWVPDAVLFQAGSIGSTHSLTAGATWDWDASWSLGSGRVGGYWEATVAAWSYEGRHESGGTWLAQAAVKPVLRWRLAGGTSPWFGEVGIGATRTNRLYETDRRQFVTHFNFGDHAAVGRAFGVGGAQEVALRVEHFSNGGVKKPNPGETFVQLRYVHRFE